MIAELPELVSLYALRSWVGPSPAGVALGITAPNASTRTRAWHWTSALGSSQVRAWLATRISSSVIVVVTVSSGSAHADANSAHARGSV
ncbi:MAG: hypothetical protein E6J91_00150 [Deltaproteobacteria bacterium]|nr:MAG: hypothetical protein E6J91_00150 [Deltaproteobacteria bacterium]